MLPCDTVPCGILYAACGMGRPGFLWSTVCQVYNGSRQSGVRKLDNVNLNLGMCYLYIGSLIPEVRPRRSIPAMLLRPHWRRPCAAPRLGSDVYRETVAHSVSYATGVHSVV
jgi:hypothetical protein